MLAASWALAQPPLDLKVSWKENRLLIETQAIVGGTIDMWYLEALCRPGSTGRAWEDTVIPHITRLMYVSEDRKQLRLKTTVQPHVEVQHEIRAGEDAVSFELTFRNRGESHADIEWGQPCMPVRVFTGADQEAYLARSFILTEEGPQFLDELPRAIEARYEGGQVYVPEGVNPADVNPRPISSAVPALPIIACLSADGEWLLAAAWSDTQELFQGVRNCLHSDFRVGGLAPGETKRVHGRIYVLPVDYRLLVSRYLEDFGGAAPASLVDWEAPPPAPAVAAGPVRPLVRAHSHNDYRHARPLFDALDLGFGSIEADIHLVDGALLVAHDRHEVDPEKTLERLYLEPLRERAEQHEGRVYPGGPPLILLIDIKGDGEDTYAVLRESLLPYANMLTHFTDDSTEERAVTVIISGSTPRQSILADSPRLAAIDGRLPDLGGPLNRHQIPLISANWRDAFEWLGQGPMPSEEFAALREMVSQAHANGQRLRFWGLPVRPSVWPVLYETGVDLLNADNLQALHDFLHAQRESR